MQQLNDTLKAQIKEAIRNAEQESSCEFVSVITQKSGDYRIYAYFVAVLSALIIPHLIHWWSDWFAIETIFQLQIVFFVVLMSLAQLPYVINVVTPFVIKRRQAALVAAESFRKFGLYRTKKRRAILFFVSLDERYATILTDTGIDEKIPIETWAAVIDKFHLSLEAKKVGEGYLEAIEACGEILKRAFPAEEGDTDELTNELIIETLN